MVKSPSFWDLAGLIEIGILGKARSRDELIQRTEGPITIKARTFYANPIFSMLYRRTSVEYIGAAKKGEKCLLSKNLVYRATVHDFWDLLSANHGTPIHPVLNEIIANEAEVVEAYKRKAIPIKF